MNKTFVIGIVLSTTSAFVLGKVLGYDPDPWDPLVQLIYTYTIVGFVSGVYLLTSNSTKER